MSSVPARFYTARFCYLLGEQFGVNPQSVHASIVAEHGDMLWLSGAWRILRGSRFWTLLEPMANVWDRAVLDRIFESTRNAAYEIIERKRSTYYAIGLGLRTIVDTVLRDQRTVLTVCTPMHGTFGVDGIALSLPTVVGHGALKICPGFR